MSVVLYVCLFVSLLVCILDVGSSTSMFVIRLVSSFTSLLVYLLVRLFKRAVSQSVGRFNLVGLSPNFPVLCLVSASVLVHKI